MAEPDLSTEIATFLRLLPELRRSHPHSWVVVIGDVLKGAFSTFEQAATFAIERFANERFLIRNTDDAIPQIPFVVVQN